VIDWNGEATEINGDIIPNTVNNINVSSTATGTLIIPAGGEYLLTLVNLNFSENTNFGADIEIGANAQVIFNILAEYEVTATGESTILGLVGTGGLRLEGGGTLTLAGRVNITPGGEQYGIYVSDSKLEITGSTTLSCTADGSFGLFTDHGDVIIDSGYSLVSIGNIGLNGYGSFEIKSGTVEIEGKIESDKCVITISDGTVTIGGVDSYENVIISGGTVTINGDVKSRGGSITISGGDVEIGGGIGDEEEVGNVTISGGTVEIKFGIYSDGDVLITGGTVEIIDEGILADGDVTIRGGDVTVINTCPDHHAIDADSIYILGGKGSFSSGTENAVLARSDATLSIGRGVAVWDLDDPSILAEIAGGTHFVAAGSDDDPLSAVEFNTFDLKIEDGSYKIEGSTIRITANEAPGGQRFAGWTITPTNLALTAGTLSTPEIEFLMPAIDVTIRANFVPLEPGEHTITVRRTGNGVANPSVNAAIQGTVITLTATPDSGNRFVRWEVISGGITLSSTTTATATFTMPNANVEVRAVFETTTGNTTPTSPQMGDIGTGTGILFAFMALGTGGATFAGVKAVITKRKK
jgi:hypothetical protein